VRPDTIENRWDDLYRHYPEVYEQFASVPHEPPPDAVVRARVDLAGKVIADVGCGTGAATFALAQDAARVIGIDPEDAMLRLAESKAAERRITNVEFLAGSASEIPLADASVDVVTAFTAALWPPRTAVPAFVAESSRILRRGGPIVVVNTPPGWYGGELHSVIGLETDDAGLDRILIEECGFSWFDFDSHQDYGSTERLARTFGFIFGRRAIDHVRRTGQTTIRWRFRVYERRDSSSSSRPSG
jgi:SAM-dependent methyltransferase